MAIKITQNDGTAIEFGTVEELREFKATQGGLKSGTDSDETADEVNEYVVTSPEELSKGDEVVFAMDYRDHYADEASVGTKGIVKGGSPRGTLMVEPKSGGVYIFVAKEDVEIVLRKASTKRRESITRDKHEDEFSVGDKVRVLSNRHYGDFEIGTIGTITSTGHNPNYEVTTNDDSWYYQGDGDIELVKPLGKDANGEDLYEGDLVTGIDSKHYGITSDKALMSVNDDGSVTVINQLIVPDYAGRSYSSIELEHFVKTTEEEFNAPKAPKFRVGDAVFFTEDYEDNHSDEAKEGTNGVIKRVGDQRIVVLLADNYVFVEPEDAPKVLEIIRKSND